MPRAAEQPVWQSVPMRRAQPPATRAEHSPFPPPGVVSAVPGVRGSVAPTALADLSAGQAAREHEGRELVEAGEEQDWRHPLMVYIARVQPASAVAAGLDTADRLRGVPGVPYFDAPAIFNLLLRRGPAVQEVVVSTSGLKLADVRRLVADTCTALQREQRLFAEACATLQQEQQLFARGSGQG